MLFETRDKVGLTRSLRFDRAAWHAARWLLTRQGPFSRNGAASNIFLRTREGLERPDVQLINMSVHNYANLWFPGLTPPPLYAFSVRLGPLHPQSRGWVRLRSANPADKPRIRFNMLTVQEDMDTTIRAIRACRDIYGQSPQRELIEREVFPGAQVSGDAELTELIRQNAGHRSHPVGTCRMGLDPAAVVDAQLRVHGIEGLRVADASIMPELPGGNTNLPSIMIGEKASDLLRGRALPAAEFA